MFRYFLITVLAMSGALAEAQQFGCTEIGVAKANVATYVQATASKNYFIKINECLVSPNRKYVVIMQAHGNFVLYPSNDITEKGHLFRTPTDGLSTIGMLVQQDGNLAIYGPGGIDPATNAGDASKAVWQTLTHSKPFDDYFLALDDLSGLALYRGTAPEQNRGTIYVLRKNWTSEPTKPLNYCSMLANGSAVLARVTVATVGGPVVAAGLGEAERIKYNNLPTTTTKATSVEMSMGVCAATPKKPGSK